MKTKVSNFTEFRKYYLSEFELYDGEAFITFNIVGIDLDRNEVQVAVSDRGRISVVRYDLLTDKDGRLYSESTLHHNLSSYLSQISAGRISRQSGARKICRQHDDIEENRQRQRLPQMADGAT